MKRVLCTAVFAVFLGACGGGGGDSDSGGGDPGPINGSFVDCPVAGVNYVADNASGITDADGDYSASGEITFLIGDIRLGSAPAASFLTPVDLAAGAGGLTDPASDNVVTNLIRLLQTLDADGEVRNGIQISQQVREAGLGRSLDFEQSVAAFEQDPDVRAFLDAALGDDQPGLVPTEQARDHLRQTLAHIAESGAPNRLPRAAAGEGFTVNAGEGVSLDGTASSDSDGQVVDFQWAQGDKGPQVALSNADSATPAFTAPDVDATVILDFILTVSDDDGGLDLDRVTVTVFPPGGDNAAPMAAGGEFATDEDQPLTAQLVASDPDGDQLVYSLVAAAANGQVDLDTDTGEFSYTPAVDFNGSDSFTYRVSDGRAESGTATVSIEVAAVNDPPHADAGVNQSVVEGDAVNLDGTASADVEGPVSFAWTQTAGPAVALQGADTANPSFTAPDVDSQTTLTFELTVTDGNGASDTDNVNVTVVTEGGGNRPPVADAGDDQTVDEQTPVSLNGSGSSDPDGEVASFAWTQTAGPAVDLDGADTANPGFTAPSTTDNVTLTFQLTVSDDFDATDSDTVDVLVRPVNAAPTAEAGPDQTVDEGDGVQLDGSASTDSDGEIEDFLWEQTAGPNVVLNDPSSPMPSFTAPTLSEAAIAKLSFRLSVTDNEGATDSDLVNVFVKDVPVGLIRAGSAKRRITPAQRHIDGIEEPRIGGTTHSQKFNLGGFGIDPTQNLPDPVGGFGDQLTQPAEERVFAGSRGEEHTWLRTLVLERRNEDDSLTQIAFVVIDAVGAGNIIQAELKAAVTQATGIPANNILFGQTHTHAGADLQGLWGGVPQDWIQTVLYPTAAVAVREAQQTLRPARLTVKQIETGEFNNFRRPRIDPDWEADQTMTLLQAVARRQGVSPEQQPGDVIGSILQYNAHPTSVNEDPRIPHADFILGAVDWLEDPQRGGGVALYYNGPIADASSAGSRPGCEPVPGDGEYGEQRCKGEGMADAVLSDPGAAARELGNSLEVRTVEDVVLPITNPAFIAAAGVGSFNRYYDFLQPQNAIPFGDIPGIGPQIGEQSDNLPQLVPTAMTPVTRITIGGAEAGLEIVTLPGEATNTFGEYIQGLADTDVMFLGLTHNSLGYIIPEDEFSYLDPGGDTGFTAPYTNYEEFVSLGPLTAPLLRLQAYNPLFDAPPEADIPPWLAACQDSLEDDCIANFIGLRLDQFQRGNAEMCREIGGPEAFCDLIDPETPFLEPCLEAGLPEGVCAVFGSGASGGVAGIDPELIATAAEASFRGCDILDPAHCMMPFPSDHFTVAAAPGSIQSTARGGTGKRINISILGMPRNTAGKPVDPTEWNRNDGFSPGQMIATVVPGLAFDSETGSVPGAPPITDIERSLFDADSAVMVIDAETGMRHPVWAEIDLNAPFLFPSEGIESPIAQPPALMIRPAENFKEGHRYIVVLRDLRDESGSLIPANPAFAACRDEQVPPLPQVQARCTGVQQVLSELAEISEQNPLVDVARDQSLFLAWDFTVASQQNLTARLLHMRDRAFESLADGAPSFTVDTVIDNPNGEIARRIEGKLTVPSFLIPVDASPLGEDDNFQAALDTLGQNAPDLLGQLQDQCNDLSPLGEVCDVFDPADALDLVSGFNLPPNRLFYNPLDGVSDLPYGDGLPDRTGELTVEYTCNVPKSAVDGKPFAEATAADVAPARPSLYGHGLLGSRGEVNNTAHVGSMGNAHNMMFCAVDWFGFATGDLLNVLTTLVDMSLFPVVPDASQQGMVIQMFLARLLKHEQGFAADPAFQVEGQPVFDRSEVFYDGNSQGGILGGVVVATSPDVHRGVLGVPGMNYSTLLRRSVDFDIYSIPLYAAYTNTLDRTFLLSFMEMVWERAENNGYAHHLNHDPLPGLDGEPMPTKRVLLHPAYADHQVTMWSADVMARTMLAAVDGSRTDRHPDAVPFALLDPIEPLYVSDPERGGAGSFNGSALVIWDEPWTGVVSDRCVGQTTPVPPIGNVPPRVGDDPHECPRREVSAQCQKSHFLHQQGAVVDVSGVQSRAECPSLPATGPAPGAGDPAGDDGDPLSACLADPSSQECPIAPLTDVLDPSAVTGLLNDLQSCQDAPNPDQCVQETLVSACQPKITADSCLAGTLIDDALDTIDDPPAISEGDPDPNPGALGDSYAVYIPSDSGEVIAFQVLEPAEGSPALSGKYPLVLHGHGYGGSRETEASSFGTLRGSGYGVISIDQRGFGESSGTVRVMDPDFEGQDLIRILDWAEANLDWLAYAPASSEAPDTGLGKGNPLVGAIGGSYGGGYQLLLLNVDPKRRLDALVPDIAWNDLRLALNPGDVTKSGWDLALSGFGDASSGGQQDPFIKETLVRGIATGIFPSDSLAWFNYHSPDYFCGPPGQRKTIYPPLPDFPGAEVVRDTPPAADILFTQGMRDTLFNFNEAFYNYQCYKALDPEVDVRLYTHQSGHILPLPSVGSSNLLAAGGGGSCGGIALGSATERAWFDEHLKGMDGAADAVLDPGDTGDDVCLSLADGDAVMTSGVPVGDLAGSQTFDVSGLLGGPVIARTGVAGALPVVVELTTVDAGGEVLAGVPRADLRVTLPAGVVPDVSSPVGDLIRPFDSILFLGIGRRSAGGDGFELIDDQLMPVRGLGDFEIDLVGVAERLQAGDTLGLMIWGMHGQYPGSFSRDLSVALVEVSGKVALPLGMTGSGD